MTLGYDKFPAKILLFGEYTVLLGGHALAIPYYGYSGTLSYAHQRNDIWNPFYEHLSKINHLLYSPLNLSALTKEIDRGLFFKSNIPEGYGLGSSGALTAAVYDAFRLKKTNDFTIIKNDLGLIENFFHGNSSGFDPLVCFIKSTLKAKNGQVRSISMPRIKDYSIFLIDTGFPRETNILVKSFRERLNELVFKKKVNQLKEISNSAIQAYTHLHHAELFSALNLISEWQWNYFSNLIPGEVIDQWKSSLNEENIAIKLCGAGGGGFFLAFVENNIDQKNIPENWIPV